jgi:hypothetical protein
MTRSIHSASLLTLGSKNVRFYSNSSVENNAYTNAIHIFKTRKDISLELAVANALNIELSNIRCIEPTIFKGIDIRFKPSFLLENPNFLQVTSKMLEKYDIENVAWTYRIEVNSHSMNDFFQFILKRNGFSLK